MIALGVIIPLVLYFVLARWLFDKYYRGTNENLRKWLRRGVLSLPFLDIIIGFIIFGFLCLFSGGTHIYQTVDDVEAQKAYWFGDALNIMDKKIYSERSIEIDESSMSLLKRVGMLNTKVKQNKPQPIKHVGYINYCKSEYDTLSKTDSNYLLSCKHMDKIIQQYDIQNVIKPPPKSPYYYEYGEYTDFFSLGFVKFGRNQDKLVNDKTNEVLAIHNEYTVFTGWFFKIIGSLYYIGHGKPGVGAECCRSSYYDTVPKMIPNPYKKP